MTRFSCFLLTDNRIEIWFYLANSPQINHYVEPLQSLYTYVDVCIHIYVWYMGVSIKNIAYKNKCNWVYASK